MSLPLRRLLQGLFALAAVVLAGGAGYYLLGGGHWLFREALYMSLITVSTVGFAELPRMDEIAGARMFTAIVIVGGIGTVAYFQSAMTALLVEGTIGHAWRKQRMRKTIDGMSGHVVICGVGSTGRHVVEELLAIGTKFVVIDKNRTHIDRVNEEIAGGKLLYVQGEATEDEILKEAGIDRASGVITALSDDKDNLYVTLSARSMNPTARIIARVIEPEAAPKMARAGANGTVSPNRIGGKRMASELVRPVVVAFLDDMMRDKDKNLRLEEVSVPERSRYAGHPLRDVPIRRDTNVLVVAIREAEGFQYNPGPDHLLRAGSLLVVMGATVEVQKLREMMEGSLTVPAPHLP